MKHRTPRNRLKVLRAERSVTQVDLAIAMGFSQAKYSLIERGYYTPNDAERNKLAKVLRVDVSELGFTGAGDEAVAS